MMSIQKNNKKYDESKGILYKLIDCSIVLLGVILSVGLALFATFVMHRTNSWISIVTCSVGALFAIARWLCDRKAIEASCGTDCKYDDEETAYKLIKSTIEGCLLVFTFVCVLCGLDRI
ncbi:hypothetical protein HXT50_05690 [Gardnerella sp. KA00243]|uniref:hypothetical protein n=1 Tax=Gardnerella TaxID=2701 RepID=UPI0039707E5D